MGIIDIERSNFEQEVLQSSEPVLIDFFASWCLPCKLLSSIIQEISSENENLKVCRINVEEEPELAELFEIMSIPTLVYMEDGSVLEQFKGFCDKDTIQSMLKK